MRIRDNAWLARKFRWSPDLSGPVNCTADIRDNGYSRQENQVPRSLTQAAYTAYISSFCLGELTIFSSQLLKTTSVWQPFTDVRFLEHQFLVLRHDLFDWVLKFSVWSLFIRIQPPSAILKHTWKICPLLPERCSCRWKEKSRERKLLAELQIWFEFKLICSFVTGWRPLRSLGKSLQRCKIYQCW